MKKFFSILFGKIIIIFCKITGNNGSSFPGKIAFKIDNFILKKLSTEVKKAIIVVCGTNGKTTTNNMIEQILKKKKYNIVCNKIGANMYYGIVTAFIEKASLLGNLKADYATLEVDELSSTKILSEINPDYFILTNLFRDQLDRYGELDFIIKKFKESLKNINKNTVYILNADDPLSSSIVENNINNNIIYYGIEKTFKDNTDEIKESKFCPLCSFELKYNFYHYSQLGDYYCSNCLFKRPKLDVEAKKISLKNGISFDLFIKNKKYSFYSNYYGFYNIYNILASIAVTKHLGIDVKTAENVLKKYKTQLGRMESFFINKKTIFLNLIKNPAGFNQSIKNIIKEKSNIDIVLILNDKDQDGKDISWIWDSQFQFLNKYNILNFYLAGTRAYELALRLKYENINKNKINIFNEIPTCLKKCLCSKVEKAFIFVTYTALFETRKLLKK